MDTKQSGQYTCATCGKKLASQSELSEHGKTCGVGKSDQNR